MNQHAWKDESKDERRWIEGKVKNAVAIRRKRKRTPIIHETSWVEPIKGQWNWKGSSKLTLDWSGL